MKFTETPLKGAYLIDLTPREDERGFFARLFCSDGFKKRGLESQFVQVNNSASKFSDTLRGMHYQLPPHEEVKIVRCIRGSLYDVIVDLREDSPTFRKWFGHLLSENNRTMMYVPKGFAHGFLSLEHNAEVLYLVSQNYAKDAERGVRWNDPAFDIKWPKEPLHISERDRQHEDFIYRG